MLFLFTLSVFVIPAFAEVRVTPFGIFDPGEDTKISYNVKTENGVETRSETLKAGSFSNPKELNKLAEKLGSVKFVLSPPDSEVIEDEMEFLTYSKPETKSSVAQFKTRIFNRAKTLIISETRKYYKKNVPDATMPNGAFINEGGGVYTLVNKKKQPIGVLIIAYQTDFVPPLPSEIEGLDFVILSKIPSNWRRTELRLDGWDSAVMPSGEKIFYKNVGNFYRCVGFKVRTTIKYTFNKLKKEKRE